MRFITCGMLCLLIINNVVMAKSEVQAQFHCVDLPLSVYDSPKPPPILQPPNPNTASAEPEALPTLCHFGQIPQPLDRFGPKGHHRIPNSLELLDTNPLSPVTPSPATPSIYYFYNSAYQFYSSTGTSANITQPSPYLAPPDFHTLAEITAESSDGRQVVELGWTVDRNINGGSTAPHLFTFHWIDGNPTCYNGCGYVQVSSTRYPGMPVNITTTPQEYTINYFSGNWWIGYQNEWIGYFPGTLWGGGYTNGDLFQWFGEVSAMSNTPCTYMGDGLFGTNSGASGFSNINFLNGINASLTSIVETNPNYYKFGNISGSDFKYGGPGYCNLATPSYALNLTTSGTGTVTSSPAGINCGATCSQTYSTGASVSLTAIPSNGNSFIGWGGGCSGYGNLCTVTMNSAQNVTANFTAFKIHQPVWKRVISSIIPKRTR